MAALPPLPRVAASLRQLPCKPLLVLTFLCLALKEQYPFSNFPMYSTFENKTYYVHLADGADQPVPTAEALGLATSTLKKIYDGEVRRELRRLQVRREHLTAEQKQAIGGPVLARLKKASAAQGAVGIPEVLRLYQVDIALAGGRFEKRRSFIAELR